MNSMLTGHDTVFDVATRLDGNLIKQDTALYTRPASKRLRTTLTNIKISNRSRQEIHHVNVCNLPLFDNYIVHENAVDEPNFVFNMTVIAEH